MAFTIPNHFIYALVDLKTLACRYVGKTADARKRLRAHMAMTKAGERTHKANWLRSLDGLRPQLEVLEETTAQDAGSREIWWIAEMRRRGYALTNATDGGEGQCGLRHTAETKAKMSVANKGRAVSPETRDKIRVGNLGKRHALGCRHSPEARERHRLAAMGKAPFRGRRHSEETKEKMRAAQRGHPVSELTRAKISTARKKAATKGAE